MSLPSGAFHMRHDAQEDRVLVLIDVAPDRHYAMALTRRLLKQLLGALADMRARVRSGAADDAARRDAVLGFEHAHAVARGFSSGETRRSEPVKALVAAPRLIREIKLTPRPDRGVVLVFDDRDKSATIELDPDRLHSFMAALLDIAATAGWDLPRIAAWLERASAAEAADTAPKLMH